MITRLNKKKERKKKKFNDDDINNSDSMSDSFSESEEPSDELSDEPSDEPLDEPSDEPSDEPLDEPLDKPSREQSEESCKNDSGDTSEELYETNNIEVDDTEEYDDDDFDSDKIGKLQNIILVLNNKRKYHDDDDDDDDVKPKNSKKQKYDDILRKYNKEERKYFEKLEEEEKEKIYSKEKEIININSKESKPTRFKFLEYNVCNIIKSTILSQIENLNMMCKSSSEYFKLKNWINILAKIPIGKYTNIDINKEDDVSNYLENVKKNIDNNIFGHTETKEQIIRILAQWISNPEKTGYVIGIKGPPGVGKTKLVKECICKAMNIPLGFISLGGIDDASYLSGFNYTYEGSKYGKILDCLIKAEVMNPVFLFDELDKVSATSRGDEIINTLIHLTDPVQNERFVDKYYQEIDLDLSKSIIIFTYNNEHYINPILKDRMITINVDGYTAKEKLMIAKNYLIDELLPKYNMKKGDIIFDDKLLEYIIDKIEKEDGVRELKRTINNIISWINMMRYIKIDDNKIELPYNVTIGYYDKYCSKKVKKNEKVMSMYL
jgi:ATP-dependent Lon protease